MHIIEYPPTLKTHKRKPDPVTIIFLLLTCFLVIALFIWEGHLGINLNDEAFLWYGSAAISQGKVPIRDFYAYDPGRYYLTAFIMKLLNNDGIIASRIAEYVVQGLGFFLSLLMLARLLKFNKKIHFIYIIISALILLIWMVPLYKIYDITASIVLICFLTYVIEKNSLLSFFWLGFGVGLIAVIGRNHGVYAVFASVCALIYLTPHHYSRIKAIKWWTIGLMVGYLPIIFMLLLIPGFDTAFIKGIYFLLKNKSTNLFIPIPWPWHAVTLRDFITGIFFITLLLFALYSLSNVVLVKIRNKSLSTLQIACAFLTLPYAHYAFSRADVIHLAMGIFPCLIGLFAYLFQNHKSDISIIFSLIILFVASLIVGLPLHTGVQSYVDKNWQYIIITGSRLKVDLNAKNDIEMFKRLISQYAENGQAFLVAPFNFGMYSIFKRESPMWDLYPLFSRSSSQQINDIARIIKANPGFIVIYDFALDGNEKRRFSYTHAIIFKYIVDNFELTDDSVATLHIYVFKRKTFHYM